MMDNIIKINNLRKTYSNGFEALKGIEINIKRGEIFGLLGPNGAGKTTTIGILTGLINLTSGSVLVDGFDVIKDYNMKYTYGVLIKINRISFSFSGYQSFIPMPAFNSYNGTISIGI